MLKIITLFCFILLSSKLITSEENKVLKCNLCIGSLQSDCAKNDSSANAVQNCILPKKPNKLSEEIHETFSSCVSIVTKETERFGPLVQKGCGFLYNNINVCDYILNKVPGVVKCSSCKEDLCN